MIRNKISDWEEIWSRLGQPYLHRDLTEEDTYGAIDWTKVFYNPVFVMKVMDTIGTEMLGNPQDPIDSQTRYRHVLYSVLNPESELDDILWVTIRTLPNGQQNVIVSRERSYFVFRAIATGTWRNVGGMHLFRSQWGTKSDDSFYYLEDHMYSNYHTIAHLVDLSLHHWLEYITPSDLEELPSAAGKTI
jgi:hypothetical protein